MDEKFVTQLKHDFLDSSVDLLFEFERIITQIKGDRVITLDAIKEIFRIIHTLKGNSRASGYDDMGTMFHIFENMLAQLRNETFRIDLETLDLFYSVLEKSQDSIEQYKKDLDEVIDFGALEAEIKMLCEKKMLQLEQSSRQYKIAIIDDDASIREIIRVALDSEFKAEFFEFADGKSALNEINKIKFDLMAIDYKMPLMDGKQFLKAVRNSNNINSETPVLFISGFDPEVESEKSMVEDIFYIQKPFDINRIIYYAKCSFLKKPR